MSSLDFFIFGAEKELITKRSYLSDGPSEPCGMKCSTILILIVPNSVQLKNTAGSNSFVLSVKTWIEQTNAIRLVEKIPPTTEVSEKIHIFALENERLQNLWQKS